MFLLSSAVNFWKLVEVSYECILGKSFPPISFLLHILVSLVSFYQSVFPTSISPSCMEEALRGKMALKVRLDPMPWRKQVHVSDSLQMLYQNYHSDFHMVLLIITSSKFKIVISAGLQVHSWGLSCMMGVYVEKFQAKFYENTFFERFRIQSFLKHDFIFESKRCSSFVWIKQN